MGNERLKEKEARLQAAHDMGRTEEESMDLMVVVATVRMTEKYPLLFAPEAWMERLVREEETVGTVRLLYNIAREAERLHRHMLSKAQDLEAIGQEHLDG
jgi:fructose-1,6-bisphosphatase/sedoheptulose 1,7-bisphosphatase-like protein